MTRKDEQIGHADPEAAIYFDHNATTPLHSDIRRVLVEAMDVFGNPSSLHAFGREASGMVEAARKQVASLVNADSEEIVFTGGGSESNNTVLKMLACHSSGCKNCLGHGREIITSAIEHPSVLETVEFLRHQGVTVHVLPVDADGFIEMEVLDERLSEKTGLVSVMMANNEIGTVQDIRAIAERVHAHGALLHTDAVQAAGKIPVDVRALDVDYLSLSSHKVYGPKGTGALYVRDKRPYCRFVHGGHQEDGRRAGTINAPAIIGFGRAAELALADLENYQETTRNLTDRLRQGIEKEIANIRINSPLEQGLPNTLNVSFQGAEGEAILLYLDLAGIAVSTGSACASGSLDPSHVLLATGLDAAYAHGSVRFSLGIENTEAEVDRVLQALPPIIRKIRQMSTTY